MKSSPNEDHEPMRNCMPNWEYIIYRRSTKFAIPALTSRAAAGIGGSFHATFPMIHRIDWCCHLHRGLSWKRYEQVGILHFESQPHGGRRGHRDRDCLSTPRCAPDRRRTLRGNRPARSRASAGRRCSGSRSAPSRRRTSRRSGLNWFPANVIGFVSSSPPTSGACSETNPSMRRL